jgi:hypothetical protein
MVSRSGYSAADLRSSPKCDVRFEYRAQLGPDEARELGRIRVGDTLCVREVVASPEPRSGELKQGGEERRW